MSKTTVKVQGGHGKIRTGRGFSKKELAAAGVSNKALQAKGLFYDSRRRSNHEENVAQLKEIFG